MYTGRALLWTVCWISLTTAALGENWARFRGPNGTGQSDAQGIPSEWSADDLNWKVDLPGVGHSSPVIWEGRLFVTSGDTKSGEQLVQCYDAKSGKQLWIESLPSAPHHLHPRNSYASSTPAVDADHLYVAWSAPDQGWLAALNHQGKLVWKLPLGTFKSQHGFGTSPVVVGDVVYLGHDERAGGGGSYLMAVDRMTGKVIWKSERKSREVAYSTPCVRPLDNGEFELIFNSGAEGIGGIDPETGETNWIIDVFDKRSVSSPIVVDGLVYGSCGSGGGGNYVVAVKPGEKGQEPKIAYKIDKSAPYVPCLVAHGDLIFLWYDKGIVSCIDVATGKTHWMQRVGGNYSGSPIRVGDRIFCLSDEGQCVVIAADKEFRVLARNELGEQARSTPAVADGRMYIRTYSTLMSIGGK